MNGNIALKDFKNYYTPFLLFGIALLLTLHANAQDQKVTHFSNWNTLNIQKKLNDQWFINSEFNVRRTNFQSDWQQFIIRPIIHYKFEKNADIAIGYSFIKNYAFASFSSPINAIENNIFQQLTFKHQLTVFSLKHRLRLEERFIANTVQNELGSYETQGTNYKNRFRYRFQISIPVSHKKASHPIFLIVYDEAFFNLENQLRPQKLEQNWIFVGLSFRANNHINVRTGYHDIYVMKENLQINNQIWETTLTYQL
ncbi:DUF2490 domain-containing protein [Kordia zhangzhouensis]|uniref:DUF2490 domain-containing protein n=1 Tax=Kordia zhangzhouensis TaxID=1620405 RepID=UPI00069B3E7A|nr:DUF2490 domain-containing protein [Kordia zhangzhouensis]